MRTLNEKPRRCRFCGYFFSYWNAYERTAKRHAKYMAKSFPILCPKCRHKDPLGSKEELQKYIDKVLLS